MFQMDLLFRIVCILLFSLQISKRKPILADYFYFYLFCSARNVENQLFTQFYLSEGLGQVGSYLTLPFQLFYNICKFPLALWLSDSLVCQTLAA